MATRTKTPKPSVYEHDGMLWKPLPGATISFQEMVALRTRIKAIFDETNWNSWLWDERKDELDEAMARASQWTRAEPDFRPMTDAEVQQWMADMDAEFAAKCEADKARYAEAKALYDPDREQARWALLEQEMNLRRVASERAEFSSGGARAGWGEKHRAEELDRLGHLERHAETVIARVTSIVGDREEVVDACGMKPRDRRPLRLAGYSAYRSCEVRRLQAEVAELGEQRNASADRAERADLRSKSQMMQHRLTKLVEVQPLTAEDMCADCDWPLFQHGWVLSNDEHLCPVWPEHRDHMKRVWEIFRSAVQHDQAPDPEPVPKPQPLGVVPSGLSLAESISRLQELQQQFPDAEVRRGSAGRFELWPPRPSTTAAS